MDSVVQKLCLLEKQIEVYIQNCLFKDKLSCLKNSTIVKFPKCTGTFNIQKVSYVLLRAKEKCSVHTFLSEIFCRSAARLQDQCKMHAFSLDDATFVPH